MTTTNPMSDQFLSVLYHVDFNQLELIYGTDEVEGMYAMLSHTLRDVEDEVTAEYVAHNLVYKHGTPIEVFLDAGVTSKYNRHIEAYVMYREQNKLGVHHFNAHHVLALKHFHATDPHAHVIAQFDYEMSCLPF